MSKHATPGHSLSRSSHASGNGDTVLFDANVSNASGYANAQLSGKAQQILNANYSLVTRGRGDVYPWIAECCKCWRLRKTPPVSAFGTANSATAEVCIQLQELEFWCRDDDRYSCGRVDDTESWPAAVAEFLKYNPPKPQKLPAGLKLLANEARNCGLTHQVLSASCCGRVHELRNMAQLTAFAETHHAHECGSCSACAANANNGSPTASHKRCTSWSELHRRVIADERKVKQELFGVDHGLRETGAQLMKETCLHILCTVPPEATGWDQQLRANAQRMLEGQEMRKPYSGGKRQVLTNINRPCLPGFGRLLNRNLQPTLLHVLAAVPMLPGLRPKEEEEVHLTLMSASVRALLLHFRLELQDMKISKSTKLTQEHLRRAFKRINKRMPGGGNVSLEEVLRLLQVDECTLLNHWHGLSDKEFDKDLSNIDVCSACSKTEATLTSCDACICCYCTECLPKEDKQETQDNPHAPYFCWPCRELQSTADLAAERYAQLLKVAAEDQGHQGDYTVALVVELGCLVDVPGYYEPLKGSTKWEVVFLEGGGLRVELDDAGQQTRTVSTLRELAACVAAAARTSPSTRRPPAADLSEEQIASLLFLDPMSDITSLKRRKADEPGLRSLAWFVQYANTTRAVRDAELSAAPSAWKRPRAIVVPAGASRPSKASKAAQQRARERTDSVPRQASRTSSPPCVAFKARKPGSVPARSEGAKGHTRARTAPPARPTARPTAQAGRTSSPAGGVWASRHTTRADPARHRRVARMSVPTSRPPSPKKPPRVAAQSRGVASSGGDKPPAILPGGTTPRAPGASKAVCKASVCGGATRSRSTGRAAPPAAPQAPPQPKAKAAGGSTRPAAGPSCQAAGAVAEHKQQAYYMMPRLGPEAASAMDKLAALKKVQGLSDNEAARLRSEHLLCIGSVIETRTSPDALWIFVGKCVGEWVKEIPLALKHEYAALRAAQAAAGQAGDTTGPPGETEAIGNGVAEKPACKGDAAVTAGMTPSLPTPHDTPVRGNASRAPATARTAEATLSLPPPDDSPVQGNARQPTPATAHTAGATPSADCGTAGEETPANLCAQLEPGSAGATRSTPGMSIDSVTAADGGPPAPMHQAPPSSAAAASCTARQSSGSAAVAVPARPAPAGGAKAIVRWTRPSSASTGDAERASQAPASQTEAARPTPQQRSSITAGSKPISKLLPSSSVAGPHPGVLPSSLRQKIAMKLTGSSKRKAAAPTRMRAPEIMGGVHQPSAASNARAAEQGVQLECEGVTEKRRRTSGGYASAATAIGDEGTEDRALPGMATGHDVQAIEPRGALPGHITTTGHDSSHGMDGVDLDISCTPVTAPAGTDVVDRDMSHTPATVPAGTITFQAMEHNQSAPGRPLTQPGMTAATDTDHDMDMDSRQSDSDPKPSEVDMDMCNAVNRNALMPTASQHGFDCDDVRAVADAISASHVHDFFPPCLAVAQLEASQDIADKEAAPDDPRSRARHVHSPTCDFRMPPDCRHGATQEALLGSDRTAGTADTADTAQQAPLGSKRTADTARQALLGDQLTADIGPSAHQAPLSSNRRADTAALATWAPMSSNKTVLGSNRTGHAAALAQQAPLGSDWTAHAAGPAQQAAQSALAQQALPCSNQPAAAGPALCSGSDAAPQKSVQCELPQHAAAAHHQGVFSWALLQDAPAPSSTAHQTAQHDMLAAPHALARKASHSMATWQPVLPPNANDGAEPEAKRQKLGGPGRAPAVTQQPAESAWAHSAAAGQPVSLLMPSQPETRKTDMEAAAVEQQPLPGAPQQVVAEATAAAGHARKAPSRALSGGCEVLAAASLGPDDTAPRAPYQVMAARKPNPIVESAGWVDAAANRAKPAQSSTAEAVAAAEQARAEKACGELALKLFGGHEVLAAAHPPPDDTAHDGTASRLRALGLPQADSREQLNGCKTQVHAALKQVQDLLGLPRGQLRLPVLAVKDMIDCDALFYLYGELRAACAHGDAAAARQLLHAILAKPAAAPQLDPGDAGSHPDVARIARGLQQMVAELQAGGLLAQGPYTPCALATWNAATSDFAWLETCYGDLKDAVEGADIDGIAGVLQLMDVVPLQPTASASTTSRQLAAVVLPPLQQHQADGASSAQGLAQSLLQISGLVAAPQQPALCCVAAVRLMDGPGQQGMPPMLYHELREACAAGQVELAIQLLQALLASSKPAAPAGQALTAVPAACRMAQTSVPALRATAAATMQLLHSFKASAAVVLPPEQCTRVVVAAAGMLRRDALLLQVLGWGLRGARSAGDVDGVMQVLQELCNRMQ